MIKAVIFDMFETLVTLSEGLPYKGKQIAEDIRISEQKFREIWDVTDDDRTLGVKSFEEVIEEVLRINDRYSLQLFEKIVGRRREYPFECFRHLHPEIIPMLSGLKKENVKIGLITNCYLEEKEAITKSELYPYFDVVCMSCDLKLKKPDVRIFQNCLDKLSVLPCECLYIGDGGSEELETAEEVGMHALQATWYLRDGADQPVGRKPEFLQMDCPMDVCKAVNKGDFAGGDQRADRRLPD